MAGRKIFVGSLPNGITDPQLRAEFAKYGQVEEVFVKQGCEPGRQWAFVTFASPEQALHAKEACDRILTFPGADRPCDVMLAKNQGMFGQQTETPSMVVPTYNTLTTTTGAYVSQGTASLGQPRKIFVGSLPDGMTEVLLRAEFSKYGMIEDVFVKPNCESGRQWAFVTFATAEQAIQAAEMTNGILQFPGSVRTCEVTLARNQGMFGQEPLAAASTPTVQAVQPVVVTGPVSVSGQAPRKIFVGSLPDGISETVVRAEFSKYGQILDIFLKQGCEPGRQWGFVTFATPDQAKLARDNCDRVLMFPGSERACEVTIARHQGMFGQDPLAEQVAVVPATTPYVATTQYVHTTVQPVVADILVPEGPRKIFIGSLPDAISETLLRAEFSKYGQIVDLFLKQAAETGRHWAFITFASAEQAQYAKEATDRVLLFPGADKPCEVMLAKNQGKFGQAPLSSFTPTYATTTTAAVAVAPVDHSQPPPPATPPPPHLTPWRMYRTASGLPYYHNSVTGVTQWECPPELQAAPAAAPHTTAATGVRYSPY